MALLTVAFSAMMLGLPAFYGVCVGADIAESCESYERTAFGSCLSEQVTLNIDVVRARHAAAAQCMAWLPVASCVRRC